MPLLMGPSREACVKSSLKPSPGTYLQGPATHPQTLPWYLLAGSSHTVSVKLPPPVNESLDRAVTSLLVMAR